MGSNTTATESTTTSSSTSATSSTTTTQSTTTSTSSTTRACKNWCMGKEHRNTPWSTKCGWSACSACTACKQYVPSAVCNCDVYRDHSVSLPVRCQKDAPETWRGQPN